MTWWQIFTYLSTGILIAVVGYIIIRYLLNFYIGSQMASRLTGDGTSKTVVKVEEEEVLVENKEEYSSGYVSD
jgi:hypothetical protein